MKFTRSAVGAISSRNAGGCIYPLRVIADKGRFPDGRAVNAFLYALRRMGNRIWAEASGK